MMSKKIAVKSERYELICSFISSGQAAVEYLLLMAVVVMMMTTVMSRVKDWMLADNGNCSGNKFSIACTVKKVFSADATGNFQRFSVIK